MPERSPPMHVLRVIELRNYIDRLPDDQFDMSTFGDSRNSNCGCIAFHAGRLFAPDKLATTSLLQSLLDLDGPVACAVTYGCGSSKPLEDITKAEAVQALDRILEGDAPWS
ncbi:MAG: hypothetical protein ACREEW_14410 [Caulobacteraceae bacterium]